jgi:hypothetical protein
MNKYSVGRGALVLNEYNVEIKCKIIKVESIGIYVAQGDQLISNDDY